MTESDLRAVLLMRAIEHSAEPSLLPADLVWADTQARRQGGESAAPRAWLVQRARLGLGRLAERDAGWAGAVASTLRPASGPSTTAAALAALAGFGLGLLGDALGPAHRVNLLAGPLLLLLAWNGLVYAALLGTVVLAWARRRGARDARRPGSLVAPLIARPWPGPLRRRLLAFAARLGDGLARVGARLDAAAPAQAAAARRQAQIASVLARYRQDGWSASLPLQAARLATALHVAAACLALGLLTSLYARGLVLDYRAGWDSTFLDAPAVHRVLAVLLGPAATLSGLPLPGVEALAGLRLASGGGEGAARWIHLWALTLLLAVVLPRAALAAGSAWRARKLAADLPLPTPADDLQALLRRASGRARPVTVLPYSYRLGPEAQAALGPVLEGVFGPVGVVQVSPSLPLGAEDDLARWLARPVANAGADTDAGVDASSDASSDAGTWVALFALTATPERESHGAFVQALAQRLAAGACLQVLVDESGFRQRFGGMAGGVGADRLALRRSAWTALLAPLGYPPVFVNLAAAAPASVQAAA